MAKYLMLYHGGGMPQTEEETAQVIKAWTDWYTALGSAVADPGNPFTQAAKKVASSGAISDGPAGSMASGYSIVFADSLEQAAKMAQTCPVLKSGAEISVFESFDVM